MAMQVLRAADTLPLGSDDMHTIISAYGSFARTLADLCRMAFPHEVHTSSCVIRWHCHHVQMLTEDSCCPEPLPCRGGSAYQHCSQH